MSTLTENLELVKHAAGYEGWADDMNANLDKIDVEFDSTFNSTNLILNGDMRIAQRGTSFLATSGNYLTLDRWRLTSPGMASERTTLSDGSYGLRVKKNTSTTPFQSLYQQIEIPAWLAGQTVVLSGVVKFNIPSDSAYVFCSWKNGGAINVNWVHFGVDRTNTTDEQEFSYSFQLGTPTDSDYFIIRFLGNWEIGTVDYDFTISKVQLTLGSTTYHFKPRPIGQELALCQRYYKKIGATAQYQGMGPNGMYQLDNLGSAQMPLPVPMRTTPNIEINDLIAWDGGSNIAVTNIATNYSTPDTLRFNFSVVSGGIQYRPVSICANSANSYISLDAEL